MLRDLAGSDDGSLFGAVEQLAPALDLVAPEIGIPLQLALPVAQELTEDVKGVGSWFLHEAGLTAKENYEGLPAALGLGYLAWEDFIKPPLVAAYLIEKATLGVLEAAFSWLGGSGSAIASGEKFLGNAIGTAEKIFSDAWGWL